MIWVKICGTTSLEDALLAAGAGADALGFIFAESPRQIEPAAASEIIARLPAGIEKVGVFVNPPLQHVRDVAEKTGIMRIQLHGEEEADFIHQLRESLPRLKVTKTLRADGRLRESLQTMQGVVSVDSILLDSGSAAHPGGTGKIFDWQSARDALAQSGLELHWIIAGGLTPENVDDAIRLFQPWGVDAVSSVESAPGKKDAGKLKKFIAAAKAAQKKTR